MAFLIDEIYFRVTEIKDIFVEKWNYFYLIYCTFFSNP